MSNYGNIFVYGTLKVGGFFANNFNEVRINCVNAHLNGILYNTEYGFPGIKLGGNTIVYGELHQYKDFQTVLPFIDNIEGYIPQRPDKSLFIRKKIDVWLSNNKKQEAFVYEYNNIINDKTKVIKSGIWKI